MLQIDCSQIDANHLDGESTLQTYCGLKQLEKVKIDQPKVCNYYV